MLTAPVGISVIVVVGNRPESITSRAHPTWPQTDGPVSQPSNVMPSAGVVSVL